MTTIGKSAYHVYDMETNAAHEVMAHDATAAVRAVWMKLYPQDTRGVVTHFRHDGENYTAMSSDNVRHEIFTRGA